MPTSKASEDEFIFATDQQLNVALGDRNNPRDKSMLPVQRFEHFILDALRRTGSRISQAAAHADVQRQANILRHKYSEADIERLFFEAWTNLRERLKRSSSRGLK